MLILKLLYQIVSSFLSYQIISSLLIIYFLGRKFEWKEGRNRVGKIIAVTIFTSLLSCISLINSQGNMRFLIEFKGHMNFLNFTILNFMCMLLYLYIYHKGSILEKLYWVALTQCISSYTTLTTLFLARRMPLHDMELYVGGETLFFLIGALVISIEYMSLYSVTKYSLNFSYLGKRALIFSILVNGFWYFFIRILYYMTDFNISLLASVTILLSYILYFFMIDVLSKNINKLWGIEMENKNMKLKSKYYEEVELINQEVRKYRHDLANHLNLLYYYLETNNLEESKRYLESLEIDLREIHKEFYYLQTGNEAVDFILNSKLIVAREKNIEVKVSIGDLSELFISNINLCTLLANLLDNAIEACQLFNKGKSFIQVNIQCNKNKFMINIKNSSNSVKTDAEGNYITHKKVGDHGLGILQINRIIDQYEGFVSRKYANDVFETNILIFNVRE